MIRLEQDYDYVVRNGVKVGKRCRYCGTVRHLNNIECICASIMNEKELVDGTPIRPTLLLNEQEA